MLQTAFFLPTALCAAPCINVHKYFIPKSSLLYVYSSFLQTLCSVSVLSCPSVEKTQNIVDKERR